ncbi:MAG: AbgT family transporter [Prevotellaceae bacterium]|nr:AbgT family transporter [Prevotellaceae bacterium]
MNRCKCLIKKVLHGYFIAVVAILVCLLFASLVLSIYVDGVEGLLTPRGIRWMCINIVANFASVPLAQILLGFMAISILRESGIFGAFGGHLTMKQKRALQITGIALLVVVVLFLLLLFMPNVLLSAFGTFSHSALSKGAYGLLACLAALVGNVYGYMSGRFVALRDYVQAHVAIFSTLGGCFVLLFLASQLVCCVEFTGILPLVGDDGMVLAILKGVLYYVPLMLYVFLLL